MNETKIVNKVPGDLPLHKNEHLISDVKLMSREALIESLERQTKILANRAFISKLPDKGQRIILLKNKLEEELQQRNTKTELCEIMSGLSLDGNEQIDALEWVGKLESHKMKTPKKDFGAEDDPFNILVTHSGTSKNKLIQVEESEPLENILEPQENCDKRAAAAAVEDLYAVNLCNKISNMNAKERFLPHKSLGSNSSKIASPKPRDLSAATPPPPILGDTKCISLQESLVLQLEQAKKLKEIQIRHAADRLKDKCFRIGDKFPLSGLSEYRESPASDSEEEVGDDCELEDTGGVTFTITE